MCFWRAIILEVKNRTLKIGNEGASHHSDIKKAIWKKSIFWLLNSVFCVIKAEGALPRRLFMHNEPKQTQIYICVMFWYFGESALRIHS